MTSPVQDFDLKNAPQSGAPCLDADSKNLKKPPLSGGLLPYMLIGLYRSSYFRAVYFALYSLGVVPTYFLNTFEKYVRSE